MNSKTIEKKKIELAKLRYKLSVYEKRVADGDSSYYLTVYAYGCDVDALEFELKLAGAL